MNIAIIGSGISGLSAAYLLRRRHNVEIFERNDYPGGHANTIMVREGEASIGLDTGFIVYNEDTYPGFTALLDELGVETLPSEMSFSVQCRACGIQYGSRGLRGKFGHLKTALRPSHLALGRDVFRFYTDSRKVLSGGRFGGITVGEYAQQARFSDEFFRHFLKPLAASIWSSSPSDVHSFPLRYLVQFFETHGLAGLGRTPKWRSVLGGSRKYVQRLVGRLHGRIHLSTPVTGLRRYDGGVEITVPGGRRWFDKVVLACPAHHALAMLADASDEEREALASFEYTRNAIVLHRDGSILPPRPALRSAWNYVVQDCRNDGVPLSMVYHLNRLQRLDAAEDYCVSVNAVPDIPEALRIKTLVYEHPRYTLRTLHGQRMIAALNGRRGIFFAGAHLGYGFHEDGFASGSVVAGLLGG